MRRLTPARPLRFTPRPLRYMALTAAALLVVPLVACSSSPATSQTAASTGAAGGPEETVTFGTGTITLNLAVPFTAMGLGLFTKNNLNVQFVTGPTAAPLLAEGTADMIFDRAADVPLLTSEGKPTKAIAADTEDTHAGLVATKSVTSIAQLRAMGTNCTIASEGSGVFEAFQEYWVSKYGLHCKIATLSSYSLAPGGLVSGQYTAAVELASNVSSLVAQGSLDWLINPLSPNYVKGGYGLPYPFVNNAVMASSAYIAHNQQTITRFFEVLKETEARMKKMTNTQIAQAIHDSGVTYYASQSVQAIEEQLTGDGAAPNIFALNNLNLSTISSGVWADTMKSLVAQGVDVNPTDKRWDYSAGVDNTMAQQVFGS
jgi:ABC-type nitrate/sulfonate/bicarbonate transport system substrate-binding protein